MRAQGPIDSFGTILSGLAKRLGLESHLFEFRLQRQWREIVGDPMAAHTWPDQIRFKKLHLTVRNSVWLQQLTFLKPTLLTKLNERAGTELVTEIALRVGEIPSRDRQSIPAAHPNDAPAVNEAAQTETSAPVAAIQDPAIRQRFTEVIGTYLSRAPFPTGSDPSRVP